ncbi:alpha/beta hydrolase [Microbacterium sp. CPCC 204701]|uniref:alpha/beta hydrolase n=1 Tax=Microbacterium sp. CPCC 204701 TaxID=2493084 RepID=UPI000FD7018E|nr:alpha/beta hydrolase [Microbacterium sp. CPCC 204701]
MRATDENGIDVVRQLLGAKPRPVGWAERRARIVEVGGAWPVAADIAFETVDAGGVPAEWSRAPGADTSRVLLFLHGGGYCSGSLASHRTMATEAGRAAGISTLSLEYRLAPEHPYPAALDDARAAWTWLERQGFAADRIVVGGDSAGGNLGLALWRDLRDAGRPAPAALWLVSPWTDLTVSGASIDDNDAIDPLLHRAYLEELATAFVPEGIPHDDPRVSPLFADLTGLPPTLVQVGADETLLDDSVRLVRAAALAEADVRLHVFPHMIHAFPLWNAVLPAARAALGEFGMFARTYLA